MNTSLVRYVLTAALRDKVFLSFLVLIALGVSLSFFMGSAAVIEKQIFSLVFAAGGLRIAGVLGLSLFCVFYIRRAFDNHEVEYLLSRPIGRLSFILSHALAFMVLALFLGLMVFIAITVMVPQSLEQGHILWAFSVLIEFVIIVNAALFFSMVLPSATVGVLVVSAFYVLSRMIGQILGTAEESSLPLQDAMNTLVQIISIVTPRLDLMGQTSWLVYGAPDLTFGFIGLQGVLFSGLFILGACIDLFRRQF